MTSLMRLGLICTVIVFVATSVLSEPIAVAKKSDVPDNNKSTRHDHANGGTSACQYTKGPWSECSPTLNVKTRLQTLKKGQDETKCEKTKTIEKKCKKSKACKYERGTWSKCNTNNEMTRSDVLKNPTESDPSCEKTKIVTRTCKNKSDRNKGQQKKMKHSNNKQDALNVKNIKKQN